MSDKDLINNPKHYDLFADGTESFDVIRKTLTPEEFRSAIYLDFEGRKSVDGEIFPQPHMVGIFKPNRKGKSGKYSANFFKSDWKPASNGAGRSVSNIEFQSFFNAMTDELVADDKYLVCWTIHEEKILERHLTHELWKRLRPYIFNVHPLAKR